MSGGNPRDIIIRPVVSEKSYAAFDENVYTFVVAGDATVGSSPAVQLMVLRFGPTGAPDMSFDATCFTPSARAPASQSPSVRCASSASSWIIEPAPPASAMP